jgi:hypothetical protein
VKKEFSYAFLLSISVLGAIIPTEIFRSFADGQEILPQQLYMVSDMR